MELLSPAGSLLSCYSALKGGADAIYLGGKNFSARASATNLTDEEIKEITFYAHSIGKKVYITLNTLLFQDEFMDAVEFAKFLYTVNVDGVIIQDLGLATYLHQILPDLPLNASTQLNCHNVRQAQALIRVGFKRIVLARECDLETIRKIKALGVEIEVFAHGALCVSYSGNCLMSSFIGDRSGNRGRCAQPCRMRYDLTEDGRKIDEQSFDISTKDLMTIDYLKELRDAGVDSLKIEGRLKSNEYIYMVSKAYRHALDSLYQGKDNQNRNQDVADLKTIFSREFTKGFVLGESPFSLLNTKASSHNGEVIGKVIKVSKSRISILLNAPLHRLDGIRFISKDDIGLTVEKMFYRSEPVEEAAKGQIIEINNIEHPEKLANLEVIRTKDYLLNKEIETELKASLKVGVKATFFAVPDAPISLTLTFHHVSVTAKGALALFPEGNGTSQERILEQLNKSGEYPYFIESFQAKMEKCFIPISALNELKIKAYEALKHKLIRTNEVPKRDYVTPEISLDITHKVSAFTLTLKQLEKANDSHCYAYSHLGDIYRNENRVDFSLNPFDKPFEVLHFLIENKAGNCLIASPYCNITNSYAMDCYYQCGFKEIIVSSECDYLSISAMINDYVLRHGNQPNLGIILYGKMDMMVMKSCPIGTFYHNQDIHCGRCHKSVYELVDRIGEHYRLFGDNDCNIHILSNQYLYLFDRLKEIKEMGITNDWLIFTDEKEEQMEKVFSCYQNRDKEAFNRFKYTRGHYQKRPL